MNEKEKENESSGEESNDEAIKFDLENDKIEFEEEEEKATD
jgi:hypothetical protein